MTLVRHTIWTLLVGAGFALGAGSATAQQPAVPAKPTGVLTAIAAYRDIERGGITNDQLKEARENFATLAKYCAEVVAHPTVYAAQQDFKPAPATTQHLAIDGQFGILQELSRFIREPVPGDRKVGPDQAVYIRELGAALDAELKKLIERGDQQIVQINAARVLAQVCKGGAPAHYATVTSLLANANTPTAIKYHLYHAAANLLGAYDPYWLSTRAHVGQMDNPKVVYDLVKVLDDSVNNPVLLFPGLPENKIEKATPDQLAVIGLVRRQAIKALGQVRFALLPLSGSKTLYPSHTLARVALSAPAVVPAPGRRTRGKRLSGCATWRPSRSKRTAP
ncbi:hypothetical protein VT84_13710 [Gemmata sp. SH-PL17]|uniref:hypothetical protein n=1 Tax=Gemmata sp. SH-PL17 TaxID=1630693 RepID=UPI00078EED72|nr:hypothetical protein [Gemmata sp. SH-PL17]AMV25450.1 hypothetical protein VT84_13710 [Gemmata sp. SH-PL17]